MAGGRTFRILTSSEQSGIYSKKKWNSNFLDRFTKNNQISKLRKSSSGNRVNAGGQTDRWTEGKTNRLTDGKTNRRTDMTKLLDAFRNFSYTPKNGLNCSVMCNTGSTAKHDEEYCTSYRAVVYFRSATNFSRHPVQFGLMNLIKNSSVLMTLHGQPADNQTRSCSAEPKRYLSLSFCQSCPCSWTYQGSSGLYLTTHCFKFQYS